MAVPTQILTPRGMNGIEMELERDAVLVELYPSFEERAYIRVKPLWHRVKKLPTNTIFLRSTSDRHRVIQLSVRSNDSRFQGRWIKWTFAQRVARELQGGAAVDAQDQLGQEDSVLRLLVLPGETRAARLEFPVNLDAETQPGDFLFNVLAQDVTEGDSPSSEDWVVTTLQLRHPNSPLLRSLPSIYVEAMDAMRDSTPGYVEPPFFERFLRGFDDAYMPLDQTLDKLERLYGPFSTPSEFVNWLGFWVSLPLDENWTEMKRRRLIREAVELFRWRGTRRGLARYIEIYAGVVPEINDKPFEGMRLGPKAKLGDAKTVLGDVPPHTFVVTLAVPEPKTIREEIVHDIIQFVKPAHAAYALRIVRRNPAGDS